MAVSPVVHDNKMFAERTFYCMPGAVVLQRAALFRLIDIDGKLLDLPGENKQGDQVGNRHQTVESICNIPKQTKVDGCTMIDTKE